MNSTEELRANMVTLNFKVLKLTSSEEHIREHAERTVGDKHQSTEQIQVMKNTPNAADRSRQSYDLPFHCCKSDCQPC